MLGRIASGTRAKYGCIRNAREIFLRPEAEFCNMASGVSDAWDADIIFADAADPYYLAFSPISGV